MGRKKVLQIDIYFKKHRGGQKLPHPPPPPPMSNRVNLGFSTGASLETMKIAKIIPAFKEDDKLGCNNYK